MSNPFDLSKRQLIEIFGDVKDLYWDGIEDLMRQPVLRSLKRLFEQAMKAEVIGYVRAPRHARSSVRVDYLNGHRYRNLGTAFGLLVDIKVPRTAHRGYQPGVFKRYARRTATVDQFIREIFIQGVSTRQVGPVLDQLSAQRVSASTVSEVTKVLDAEVRAFQRRPLADAYRYLFFDGIRQRVVSAGTAVNKIVLVAYGIKHDSHREVIDYRVAKSESEAEWFGFLNSLYQRGLTGNNTRLVIIDGGKGLRLALDMVYPQLDRQRCWAHKLRNVATYVPRRYQTVCLKEAKGIYLASHYRQAVQRFKTWCRHWRATAPKAVACLEKDIEELLACFGEEPKLWIKIRTTNAIERIFKEVRRRTRPMSLFANVASCERIVYALFKRYNNRWKERRYVVF
jgi:transposase-like protein